MGMTIWTHVRVSPCFDECGRERILRPWELPIVPGKTWNEDKVTKASHDYLNGMLRKTDLLDELPVAFAFRIVKSSSSPSVSLSTIFFGSFLFAEML
jgi:hypothetical protein